MAVSANRSSGHLDRVCVRVCVFEGLVGREEEWMNRSGHWLGTGAQQNHLSQSERWGQGGADPSLEPPCRRKDVLIRKHV